MPAADRLSRRISCRPDGQGHEAYAVPFLRVRLRPAAEKPIARKRAANTALPRPSAPEAEPSGLCANAPELRWLLLAWWELHGRHGIPWKRRPDGHPAADGEPLDPYGVFVAEVMRAARQHTYYGWDNCSLSGWRWPTAIAASLPEVKRRRSALACSGRKRP